MLAMTDDFLVQKTLSRKVFGYFEIEKTQSDSIFMISIHSPYSEYLDVKVDEEANTIVLTSLFPTYSLPTENESGNDLTFSLPDMLQGAQHILKRTSRNIFLVFHFYTKRCECEYLF